MATGLQNWSQTAASNASADSSVNWAEGQSPGSVNDSSRAMMARLADYYKDLGGITTGGTATAYTLTTNRAFASSAIMDGAVLCIKPNADSGASPTLAVDGLTARAINYSTGVAITAGALKTGTPYYVIYIHASTEFILLGGVAAIPALSGPCPVGMISDYGGTAAPTGWLLCFGQSLLRSSYAALFTAIGTTYGAADGTHFSLPDCQGRVTAGKDNMSGVSADRLTAQTGGLNGDTLGATGGAETVTLDTTMIPSHTHTASVTDAGHTHTTHISLGANETIDSGKPADGGGSTSNVTNSVSDSATTGISVANSSTGGGSAHNNVQPTIVLNKIIFAGV